MYVAHSRCFSPTLFTHTATAIWLDHNPRLVDVAPLGTLTNVYYLALSFTAVEDVTSVLANPNLIVSGEASPAAYMCKAVLSCAS